MTAFRYRAWDGSQHVDAITAAEALEHIARDVLSGGDARRSVRRLTEDGVVGTCLGNQGAQTRLRGVVRLGDDASVRLEIDRQILDPLEEFQPNRRARQGGALGKVKVGATSPGHAGSLRH